MSPLEFTGYASALAVGLSLGLIGGGGSILVVPILLYLFGAPPAQATDDSLFIVAVCAAVGAIPYARRNLIQYKTALTFFIPSSLGVLVARQILRPHLPEAAILIFFSFVMLAAARSMLRGTDAPPTSTTHPVRLGPTAGWGAGIGLITGLVGAGGGFLIVPALVNGLAVPVKRAVGTSLVVIALNSSFGFATGFFANSPTHWSRILPFTGIAIFGSLLGAYFSERIDAKTLKKTFGWMVIIVGSTLLLQQLLILYTNY